MPYNEALAARILQSIPTAALPHMTEKKMFGGLCYLYKGKMAVGIVKEDISVRVLEPKMADLLELPHVREMDFTKKPLKEFVYVSPEGFKTDQELLEWIELGIEHAKTKAN